MPVYRSRTVVGIARGLKAFLNLDAGLVRGAVPDPEQELEQARSRVEQLRKRLSNKDRQLEQMRKRLSNSHRTAAASRTEPDAAAGDLMEREEQAHEALVGDARDHFIGKVVKSKSFADVDGLYDAADEKVSVAHSYGAAALTMIDTAPQGDELWRSFSDRMRYFGVSEFDTISGNMLDLANSPEHPRYDVIHCSGVLNRMPDPMRLLSALHRITREHLVLACTVVATEVDGTQGTLEALPTVDSLKAMCASAGFAYEEGAYYRNNAYVLSLSRSRQ